MTNSARRYLWISLGLWGVLALPPLRHGLESTMAAQMLLQMPLLALAGYWLGKAVPARAEAILMPWDRWGLSGLLLASMASMPWMLPRAIDAALQQPWVELAKFASLPLLVGLPVALSWPRAGFVLRGVFLLEIAATAFRLGWLYLASPVQVCSNYLVDDQQQTGRWLFAVGAAINLVLVWKLVFGRLRVPG
ncbi:MAG: hypothetical protein IT472_10645 [Thermomonas sp.]|uniref:hypothetical protein n=1 Tax=Thermomonas sp. TaxID=1971895 RepID=UPI00261B6B94|nr:hypothetical protein [Thermomonas sp.]MCC7097626.1 hypothetical protein [Thermomonas sp.]